MDRLEQIGALTKASAGDRAALAIAAELERLGADAAFVATLSANGRTVDVSRVTPFSEHPARLAFPVEAPYPLAEVMRRGDPLFIASNEQLSCDHPGLIRIQDVDHACATIPLRDANGGLLGALNLGFEDPHEFSDAEREEIQLLADRCASVLAEARGA
jgi:GAF domain-containing protein